MVVGEGRAGISSEYGACVVQVKVQSCINSEVSMFTTCVCWFYTIRLHAFNLPPSLDTLHSSTGYTACFHWHGTLHCLHWIDCIPSLDTLHAFTGYTALPSPPSLDTLHALHCTAFTGMGTLHYTTFTGYAACLYHLHWIHCTAFTTFTGYAACLYRLHWIHCTAFTTFTGYTACLHCVL